MSPGRTRLGRVFRQHGIANICVTCGDTRARVRTRFLIPHLAPSIRSKGYAAVDIRQLSRSRETAHTSEPALNASGARRDAVHHHSSNIRTVVQAVAP